MMEYTIFAIGFFAVTLVIQGLLYKKRGRYSKQVSFWTGSSVVIVLCVEGIYSKNLHTFASIIGFVTADMIGKSMNWHD